MTPPTTTTTANVPRRFLALLTCLLYFVTNSSCLSNSVLVNRRELFHAATNAATTFAILVPPPPVSASTAPDTRTPYLINNNNDNNGIQERIRFATAPQAGRSYFPTLTPPFVNRATYRYDLGRNAWAFEQLLTFGNVTATIRTHVLLLENGSGGLWVHSPQWPTGEFVQLLDELGHPVKHIVLPCNALEHKAPMRDFVRRYPTASVWISPGQYGPFGSCGTTLTRHTTRTMGYRMDGIFGDNNDSAAMSSSNSVSHRPPKSAMPPWANEFDIATLYVELPENAGPVSEVAFCHKPTKTLIATDAVVYIPESLSVPNIFSTYFDDATIRDPSFWPKTVLQSVFLPLRTKEDGSNNKKRIYPGFEALKGRLVRAPILRAFADARAPMAVQKWVTTISKFDFDRILTSHFASPIVATPSDFRDAFRYLPDGDERVVDDDNNLPPIACQDWQLLQSLNQAIAQYKLGAPVVFDVTQGCAEQ